MIIDYINCEHTKTNHDNRTDYYMAMDGNACHWCINRKERTTTLCTYSPNRTESILPVVLEFNPLQPVASIRMFYKLLMLQ